MKRFLLIATVLFSACHSANKSQVSIGVDRQQQQITVTGLPEAANYGLKSDSISTQAWQTLLMVCKMPADTELRSAAPLQPGKYRLVGNGISFKPDTPFVKGTIYFARFYRFDDGLTSVNALTDGRRPNKTPYTELVFKY
ncbi:hypothetical protein [Mucilaginibacter myungsuensis]|uniref:Lipoprotein n=1 Tax=Mucilaginibacter myungsuensis TaxID=649104 RepID=A0A929KX55_9SPHI|nr:hypothetical protein [Mucilaginibacter myungsuensis]MBE9663279.1 hypothetical protein [Mucilaginibacter myungsuensis]MDN3600014.1 hypothetical protein [Mucilaginibacter myungsuensis]